jgi:hypothetical protein
MAELNLCPIECWFDLSASRSNSQFYTSAIHAQGENILAFEDNPDLFKPDHFQRVSAAYLAAQAMKIYFHIALFSAQLPMCGGIGQPTMGNHRIGLPPSRLLANLRERGLQEADLAQET